MGKMSWLHAELSERASELGFESIEEAERNGYEMHMDGMTPTLKPNASKQLELAHKAWLEEKEQVLNDLDIVAHSDSVPFEHKEIVKQAYEFIKEQCHD